MACSHSNPDYATVDEWIAGEAIVFSIDAVDQTVDRLMSRIGSEVDLLAFGEPFHSLRGGQEILEFRNRLFQRLVTRHNFSAIAIESSFPRSRMVNEFINGTRDIELADVMQTGVSHGFGNHAANVALVEWMRQYNSNDTNTRLNFYGFDSPTEWGAADSPRQLLYFVLDFLESIDARSAANFRARIDPLLEQDWENPGTPFDPSKSVGLSPASNALRIEVEELISELRIRGPALIAASDADRYARAVHDAQHARAMLNYHAALARPSSTRLADCLGLRDLMMADNLQYIVQCERRRERGRGRVLAFAHNMHLQRGMASWRLDKSETKWWPAGAHVDRMLGSRYVNIGSAVGAMEVENVPPPEPDTLEARLRSKPGHATLIRTSPARSLPAPETNAMPIRSGTSTNGSYFPLTAQSFTDFDWLIVFDLP